MLSVIPPDKLEALFIKTKKNKNKYCHSCKKKYTLRKCTNLYCNEKFKNRKIKKTYLKAPIMSV